MVAKPKQVAQKQETPSRWQRFLNIFRASPESGGTNLSNPANWFSALFGPTSKAGVRINSESVISHTAMWRAVNILGETIASLPFEIIEQMPNGDVNIAVNHPSYNLINSEPNSLYTSFTYRHTSMVHACLHGNWFSIIERDAKTDRPIRLKIVNPADLREVMIENEQTGEKELFYRIEKMNATLAPRDVIHIPNLSFDGIMGLDMLRVHADNYGMGLANRDYVNTYYKNGTMIAGWIKFPHELSDEQYQNLKRSFRLEYGGSENAGSTPILEAGGEYHQLNDSLADAQSIEMQRFTIEDISRITGVPVHMLQNLERATFNNIEQLSLEFAMYTIRPWVKRIEQEFNRKIFRESEKGRFKVRLNMDALLRGDTESRATFYKTLWNMGVISINDIRRKEKMNSVPGGDVRYVPLNASPVDEEGMPVFQPKSRDAVTENDNENDEQ